MKEGKINIKLLNDKATIPTLGSAYSAGADLYACLDDKEEIKPVETKLISTGIAMEIPIGYVGLIYARSGLATKRGLAPANKVGVIDSDYRGEILIALYNQSKDIQVIENGERIAQIVFTPYLKGSFNVVDELEETERGNGGFGSTGTK